jgi:hypothetical protein
LRSQIARRTNPPPAVKTQLMSAAHSIRDASLPYAPRAFSDAGG